MATKGDNRSYVRRKFRRATKNVNADLGSHVSSSKMNKSEYGSGANDKKFPNYDPEYDDYINMNR